ncbi:MAG: M48 family metallopeptidase [Caldilineaceae bacterium SB0661_bin_32]|uniref:M48 family metallopeptidase n=1 Tax=Caldilineaceae bacterium SB0661_bin_32 TaxID=2605255 RepID=A0A6B1DDU8_9CHLR|nr:M48 family metallopeptidase [Caldilineaceae bacterium SB0661_bin_32]
MRTQMMADDERRRIIRKRVECWSQRLGIRPRLIRVQQMTRKWGSCSTSGIITLAIDLAEQEPGFQDFVIVHELLHLRIPNHGKLFKALMSVYVPAWKEHNMKGRSVSRKGI